MMIPPTCQKAYSRTNKPMPISHQTCLHLSVEPQHTVTIKRCNRSQHTADTCTVIYKWLRVNNNYTTSSSSKISRQLCFEEQGQMIKWPHQSSLGSADPSSDRIFGRADMPPTSRNGKFSTSLRGYSTSFPLEAKSGSDGKFYFTAHDPKIFYTYKSLIYCLFFEFNISNEKRIYNAN